MGKRVLYADYIRAIACLFVVVIHVSGSSSWYNIDVHTNEWAILEIYNTLVRCAVPLFVMLSGIFFLDPERNVTFRYLANKIIKLLVIYILWSAFYALAGSLLNGSFQLSWAGFKTLVAGTLGSKFHLWFIPMIMGLYLITPFVRPIARETRLMRYGIVLFFAFAVFKPFLMLLWPNEILSSILNRIPLEMFTGFLGYYLLGYYLSKNDLPKLWRRISYALCGAGLVVTALMAIQQARQTNEPGGFLSGEFSIVVFLTAVSIFIACKRKFTANTPPGGGVYRAISFISDQSLGIYLTHVFFIELFEWAGLSVMSFTPILSVPAITVLVLVCSAGATYLLKKIGKISAWII